MRTARRAWRNAARRRGASAWSEARTQGAFVAGGYGRDRGRRLGASGAARRHRPYFAKPFIRRLVALAAGAAVLTACAESPGQHAARLAVERAAERTGRTGDTHCTPNPRLFFAQGPNANVFICLVKVGGGVCDRYIVRRGNLRLQLREADCILPGT
jgi:hypothetical protein